jgi:hypothetical protein
MCWPPLTPNKDLDWYKIPKDIKDKELSKYRSKVEEIYKNPKNYIQLAFAQVLHKIGIFDFPNGKIRLTDKIKLLFKEFKKVMLDDIH